MLSLSAILLCLGALEVSHGLLSPEELTATFHERYPYPDIRGNPCGIRAPYEELDWWQRMYPLKTRQRTMRDLGMPEVANLVVPASRGGLDELPSTQQADSYLKTLLRVAAHNNTLPENALRRSVVHSGPSGRMHKLFRKVLAGEDISVVVLGGSISAGGEVRNFDTEAYFPQTTSWLASLAPVVANNTFLNLAKGATESNFYAHCLHDTLPHDQGVDLVIVEFAINDLPFDARVTPYMDNSKRRGLEILIRKLLRLPSRPAILMLNLWVPAYNRYSFWQHSAEEEMELLGKYYDLDVLSFRNAIYPLFRMEKHGFKEWDFMCQFVHPNLVGHTYIADMVIGWMQTRAASMLLDDWFSPGPRAHESNDVAGMQEDAASGWQLAAPLLMDAKDSDAETCFEQEALQRQLVENQGWLWEEQVTSYGQRKAGYVSTHVGATIDFELNTAVDKRPSYVAMLGVGVLKSHARMGVLGISCLSGCTCTPVEFDTQWHQKISLRQLLYFNTTCHPNCILRFTNVKPNHSTVHERGHRLKLNTLVVMGSIDNPVSQEAANALWQPSN